MIAPSWIRFHWNTGDLPALKPLKAPFIVRLAKPEEEESVLKVALLALTMNTDWHDATHEVQELLKRAVQQAFQLKPAPGALVITHGSRIIAVSLIDYSHQALEHLVSGPWVLSEYRNRGFGTALLYASLEELHHNGVTLALGLTRKNSVAAQFVYPKFGGKIESLETPIQKELIF